MPWRPHVLISLRGAYLGTPEKWSMGWRFDVDTPFWPDPGVDTIDKSTVAEAFRTFFATASAFPQVVVATDWRAYQIGMEGRMVGEPTINEFDVATRPAGTVQLPTYPPQVTLAVTHMGASRGRGRFGRVYLPTPAQGLGPDLRLPTGGATLYLNAYKTMVNSLAGAIQTWGMVTDPGESLATGRLGTFSNINSEWQPVETLRVGRVLDTQRRRRRSMVEDYLESAL